MSYEPDGVRFMREQFEADRMQDDNQKVLAIFADFRWKLVIQDRSYSDIADLLQGAIEPVDDVPF